MTIETPRTQELANELTALTQETPETAVVRAIEERLEREKKRQAEISALREIARQFHEAAPPGLSSDHSFLYDERGLPK